MSLAAENERVESTGVSSSGGHGLPILAVALALAVTLRFALANYSFWVDEYASLFFAQQPFSRLWSDWMVRETNPPLFYTILRGWILVAGRTDPVLLRVPSIIASLAMIPVTYVSLARIYGAKPAALIGLVLAVSAQQVAYAHQVRAYSFLSLALAVSFFGLLWIVTANERRERQSLAAWAAYAGGAVVANYLHTTAFLWLPIATLCLMLADRHFVPLFGRDWRKLALANLVILLCSGWALRIVYLQLQIPNDNISWLKSLGVTGSATLFWRSSLLIREPWWRENISVAVVLAVAISGFLATRRMAASRLTMLCWIVAIAIYFAVSYKQPILMERVVVWIAIFPLTLICAALSRLRWPSGQLLVTGLLVALLTYNLAKSRPRFEKEPWQAAITHVARDPKGVLIARGEEVAVASLEACKLAMKQDHCPFPIVTLVGMRHNGWAKGYAPPAPKTSVGRLALDSDRRLYFIQRHNAGPLIDLQAAGLMLNVPPNTAFFLGPYSRPAIDEIKQATCVRAGLLMVSCRK